MGGYGANLFYYLRQDVSGRSTFGTINPTPGGIATDRYTVGTNFDALVFIPQTVSDWGTAILPTSATTMPGRSSEPLIQ